MPESPKRSQVVRLERLVSINQDACFRCKGALSLGLRVSVRSAAPARCPSA
jgi:hypothetical protein